MSDVTLPTVIVTRKRVSYPPLSPSQIHTPIGVIGASTDDERPTAVRSRIDHRATQVRAA